jgi:hypothetical protein
MTFINFQRYQVIKLPVMNKHTPLGLFPGVDSKRFVANNYCIKTLLISFILLSQFSFRTNVQDSISDHQKMENDELVVPAGITTTASQQIEAKRLDSEKTSVLLNSSPEGHSEVKTRGYNKRSGEMYRIML